MESREIFFKKIKSGLIVSCQALEHEPLFGSDTMAKMAAAAVMGGACAIRANGASDITAIKTAINLPVIGLVKRDYPDSDVYITPTRREVDELLEAKVDMIALDATSQKRPQGEQLKDLIAYIKEKGCLVMSDISTCEEGIQAENLGADCVSTTLSGYTPYSVQQLGPDFELIEQLSSTLSIPVIAEGRIGTPDEAKKAMDCGAYAVVIGSAITRPQLITKSFVDALTERK